MEVKLKGLKDFPEIETLATFDFRTLIADFYRYYEMHPKNQGNQEYAKLLRAAEAVETIQDPIEKWFLYRRLDESRRYPFDCDNSRTTCQLASEVYEALWENSVLRFCKKIGSPSGEQKETFVGDTMNSVLTTLNELAKSEFQEKWWSWERWKELHDSNHEQFEQFFDANPKVKEFVAVAHTLGNLLPWPVGCNALRGTSPQIKDYWDLTLDRIYWWYQKNRKWLKEIPRFPQNDMIVGLFDSQTVNFDQYLTVFGSWDVFVEKNFLQGNVEEPGARDEKYGRPKELWRGHLAKATPVLPAGDEIFEYFENATKWIQNRSALMVAALNLQERPGK